MTSAPAKSVLAPTLSPSPRKEASQGMVCLDTTSNPNIPVMMELVGALSRATDPREVLRVFSEGLGKLYGPRGYISLSTRNLQPGEYRITRMLLEDGTTLLHNADPWSVVASLPVYTGGFLGGLIRSAYPEVIHHLDLRSDPVLKDALKDYKSLMAIPLFDNGEPLNWSIQLDRDPEGFSVEDLEHAILRANLVGNSVRNTLMSKQLLAANERIQREVEAIARIQRAMLPQSLPTIPGIKIASNYETFDTAGGDLYDFLIREPGVNAPEGSPQRLGMIIADASGHGPAASVVTAMLNSILYAYPHDDHGAGAVLRYANRHLHSKQMEGTFVTAFLGSLDVESHTFTYANAGHPPPLLKNPGPGGSVTRLNAVGGIPLGILNDVQFEDGTVQLRPGQTLVLYTDGINEAMNPQGEMFGIAGIERALEECTGEPSCVVQSITTALKEHQAGQRPSDDQTIVAVKIE